MGNKIRKKELVFVLKNLFIVYRNLEMENRALKEEIESLRCTYIKNYKKQIDTKEANAEELSIDHLVDKFKDKGDEKVFFANGFWW